MVRQPQQTPVPPAASSQVCWPKGSTSSCPLLPPPHTHTHLQAVTSVQELVRTDGSVPPVLYPETATSVRALVEKLRVVPRATCSTLIKQVSVRGCS